MWTLRLPLFGAIIKFYCCSNGFLRTFIFVELTFGSKCFTIAMKSLNVFARKRFAKKRADLRLWKEVTDSGQHLNGANMIPSQRLESIMN